MHCNVLTPGPSKNWKCRSCTRAVVECSAALRRHVWMQRLSRMSHALSLRSRIASWTPFPAASTCPSCSKTLQRRSGLQRCVNTLTEHFIGTSLVLDATGIDQDTSVVRAFLCYIQFVCTGENLCVLGHEYSTLESAGNSNVLKMDPS